MPLSVGLVVGGLNLESKHVVATTTLPCVCTFHSLQESWVEVHACRIVEQRAMVSFPHCTTALQERWDARRFRGLEVAK